MAGLPELPARGLGAAEAIAAPATAPAMGSTAAAALEGPPGGAAATFDVEAAIGAFLADPQRSTLELPHMSTEDRKRARRLAERHAELTCESFGFGADRQLHIFKATPQAGPAGQAASGRGGPGAATSVAGAKTAPPQSGWTAAGGAPRGPEPILPRSRRLLQPKSGGLQPCRRTEGRSGSEPVLLRSRRLLLPKGALLPCKRENSSPLSPISEGLEDHSAASSPKKSASPRRPSLRMPPPDASWRPPLPTPPGAAGMPPPPPPRPEGKAARSAATCLPGMPLDV